MDQRVEEILEDYRPWEFHQQCLDAFGRIKNRLHTPVAKEIEELLQSGNYHDP